MATQAYRTTGSDGSTPSRTPSWSGEMTDPSPPPSPPSGAPAEPDDLTALEVAHPFGETHLDEVWRKRFMVQRDGRPFVLYAGLLDLGHRQGLRDITTTLVQLPSELNGSTAVVHATVVTDRGTYTGLGDANPANVTRMMVPHLIRMAETRAKARALRDATNVGVTAFEELGEASPGAASEPAWGSTTSSAAAAAAGGGTAAPRRVQPLEGPINETQRDAIASLEKALHLAPSDPSGLSAAAAGFRIVDLQAQLQRARSGAKGATS